jgi:hypothetical protein
LVSPVGFIDYFFDNNNYYEILKEQKVINKKQEVI